MEPVGKAPASRCEAALCRQFPGRRIRKVTGQWVTARQGAPVAVRSTVFEPREAIRPAGPAVAPPDAARRDGR